MQSVSQIDLYLLGLLGISVILGSIRGFSGELGALLKLVLTLAITYFVISLIKKSLGGVLSQNLVFTGAIFTVTYILVSFILKIFIHQMVDILKNIIPYVIDKPFGIILAYLKMTFLLCAIYLLTMTVSFKFKLEEPEWISGSYTEQYLEVVSRFVLDNFTNVEYEEDNIGDNNLFVVKAKKDGDKLVDKEKKGKEKQENETLKKVEEAKKVIDLYKSLQGIDSLSSGNLTEEDMESLDQLLENLENN